MKQQISIKHINEHMTQYFSRGNPKGKNLFFLRMKGKLQLLFTFFYFVWAPTQTRLLPQFSSAATEWKLQLPNVQAPTCTCSSSNLNMRTEVLPVSLATTRRMLQHPRELCSPLLHPTTLIWLDLQNVTNPYKPSLSTNMLYKTCIQLTDSFIALTYS